MKAIPGPAPAAPPQIPEPQAEPRRRCVVLLYHRLTPEPARQRYETTVTQARRHWQALAQTGACAGSLRALWRPAEEPNDAPAESLSAGGANEIAGRGTGFLPGPARCQLNYLGHVVATSAGHWNGEARKVAPPPGRLSFALSFDDGSDSDFQAAQWLWERGWRATFFANPSRLGKPGYLAWGQLRELAAAGFEIGSHGDDHLAFTRLSRTQMEYQIRASKHRLEDGLGEAIAFLAAPFGAWRREVLEIVRQNGYQGLAISRPAPATCGAFLIPRYGIRRDMRAQPVVQLVQGGRQRAQEYLRGRGLHIWRSWRQGACAGNW